jgi:hypothetical protein
MIAGPEGSPSSDMQHEDSAWLAGGSLENLFSGAGLAFSEASEYLVAQTSTTRNPYLYLGRATQYRFASFKRSTMERREEQLDEC